MAKPKNLTTFPFRLTVRSSTVVWTVEMRERILKALESYPEIESVELVPLP